MFYYINVHTFHKLPQITVRYYPIIVFDVTMISYKNDDINELFQT